MRKISGRNLWIGNAGDLRDARAVMAAGIEAVVEVADCEQMAVLPRELVRLRFPLSDGGDNPAWLLHLAIDSVAELLRKKIPVVVCCSAGISRSVCIAAGGIALTENRSLAEAVLDVIEAGASDVSPRLLVQLQKAIISR